MCGRFSVARSAGVAVIVTISVVVTPLGDRLFSCSGRCNSRYVDEDVSFRVTGVRLKGSRTDHLDPREHGRSEYDFAVTGFRAYGKSVIVDNCEVFGWTSAGFIPGTKSTPTRG
jgi:hypothetical protein